MDFYPDQHAYRVARMAVIEDDANENDSWVMLSREGEIVKLPHEKIFYKVRSRIGLELATPKVFRDAPPFSAKSDSGLVYITNSRFIYLPARPTDAFKSFSAPILNFEDTHVTSTFFGPWTWNGIVKPVSRGGIPPEIPRLEIKLTFREGGHDAFQTKFETMKERLQHARDLQQETGQQITTDEPLPQYEPRGGGGAPPQGATSPQTTQAGPGPGAGAGPSGSSQSQGRSNQPQPDEPPPDYEEAQAQAIDMRLEDHVREEADRE